RAWTVPPWSTLAGDGPHDDACHVEGRRGHSFGQPSLRPDAGAGARRNPAVLLGGLPGSVRLGQEVFRGAGGSRLRSGVLVSSAGIGARRAGYHRHGPHGVYGHGVFYGDALDGATNGCARAVVRRRRRPDGAFEALRLRFLSGERGFGPAGVLAPR